MKEKERLRSISGSWIRIVIKKGADLARRLSRKEEKELKWDSYHYELYTSRYYEFLFDIRLN